MSKNDRLGVHSTREVRTMLAATALFEIEQGEGKLCHPVSSLIDATQ
jgi:hypothetical protein